MGLSFWKAGPVVNVCHVAVQLEWSQRVRVMGQTVLGSQRRSGGAGPCLVHLSWSPWDGGTVMVLLLSLPKEKTALEYIFLIWMQNQNPESQHSPSSGNVLRPQKGSIPGDHLPDL